jgi:flagella basal body P-ring formation protein FlgA
MWRVIGILTLLLAAAAAEAGELQIHELRLRSRALVHGDAARLADVLVFGGDAGVLREAIGDESIEPPPTALEVHKLTRQQVAARLDALGVNMARIVLRGATTCELVFRDGGSRGGDDEPAPLLRNRRDPRFKKQSLATLLEARVNAELAEIGGTAELRFDRSGQEFLSLTTPPYEFNITTPGSNELGLREFRVVIRRDGKTQQTVRLYAQVRITREVVVARQPLSMGTFVRRDDVALEERVFGPGEPLGVDQLEAVLGQQVKHFVPVGALVQDTDIKAVDLVRRSRHVTVLSNNPNVQLRLTGTALDHGGFGDPVRVRLGDRQSRQVVRGVVTGLGTVKLVEDVQ